MAFKAQGQTDDWTHVQVLYRGEMWNVLNLDSERKRLSLQIYALKSRLQHFKLAILVVTDTISFTWNVYLPRLISIRVLRDSTPRFVG